jgi:hypothetical protein
MCSLLAHAEAAKAVITPKGAWTKRARQRGNAHCALGAIEEVLGLVPETAELDGRGAALIIALARELGVLEYAAYHAASRGYFSKLCYVVHCASVVMKHNDARSTTQRTVLRLFERVIARLEAEAKHRRSGQQLRQLAQQRHHQTHSAARERRCLAAPQSATQEAIVRCFEKREAADSESGSIRRVVENCLEDVRAGDCL